MNRTYEIAEVCGARLVTLGVTLPVAKRMAPVVERHDLTAGIQGRPDMNPTAADVIATPAQYEEAVSLSKRYAMSFDIGDAVGGGYDVVRFVQAHHERIALLYLKDRRKDGLSVPWGEGDAPVREIVRLIRDRGYPVRCYVDCDYKTENRPADVKRSFEFARAAVNS